MREVPCHPPYLRFIQYLRIPRSFPEHICEFVHFLCVVFGRVLDGLLRFYETSSCTKSEFVILFAAICHLPFWCFSGRFGSAELNIVFSCFVRDTGLSLHDVCVLLRNAIVAVYGRNTENTAAHFPLFPALSLHGLWAMCRSSRCGQPGTQGLGTDFPGAGRARGVRSAVRRVGLFSQNREPRGAARGRGALQTSRGVGGRAGRMAVLRVCVAGSPR